MPFVEKEKYQISNKCRLHPDNDMFRDQELHKINHDVNEWRCGYCKKSFYAEKYIDKHFDNRHYHLLNAVSALLLLLHCTLRPSQFRIYVGWLVLLSCCDTYTRVIVWEIKLHHVMKIEAIEMTLL